MPVIAGAVCVAALVLALVVFGAWAITLFVFAALFVSSSSRE